MKEEAMNGPTTTNVIVLFRVMKMVWRTRKGGRERKGGRKEGREDDLRSRIHART